MSDSFGINPLILERAWGKCTLEMMSGKGGLLGLLWRLDNLDFVPDIQKLTNEISLKFTFLDAALRKCSNEAIARPEQIREDEIASMLGYTCVTCGKTLSALNHRTQRVCACKGKLSLTYLLVHKKLRDMNIVPTPETVLMWVAYEGLADAYVEAFHAFKKVMLTFVQRYGWSGAIQFLDIDFKDKLDSIFYYYEPGDLRLSKEERECLMFIPRAVFAEIPIAECESTIRAAINVCKFGYFFDKLFCSGADNQYNLARVQYSLLYNAVNEKIRLQTSVSKREREKRIIDTIELDGKYYAMLLMNPAAWMNGKVAKHLTLKPVKDLPIYSTYKDCAVNAIVAPSGKGKTTLMANLVCQAFEEDHPFIFDILGDEANSLTLASLPCFPAEGRTGAFLKMLELMRFKPKAIPTLNLLFLREGEERTLFTKSFNEAVPATKYCRIVDIEDAYAFNVEFKNSGEAVKEGKESPGILNVLGEFALELGYANVCGLVNVINCGRLERTEQDKEIKPDIEVATVLMDKFALWRQSCKSPSARIVADEASYLAPLVHSVAGTDTSKSSSTLSGTIKKVRKLNTSFDIGTQKWSEINPDARAEALNIWFRELPQAQDKGRSQRDIVLESLMLKEGKAERELVASMMERGSLPEDEFWWFWWNRNRRDVQVVKPTVPCFMVNQPKKTNRQLFKEYEKAFGKEILLDNGWQGLFDDPKMHLRYEDNEYFKPNKFHVS